MLNLIPGLTVDGFPVFQVEAVPHTIQTEPVNGVETWALSGLPSSLTITVAPDSPLLTRQNRMVIVRFDGGEMEGYLVGVRSYAGEDDDLGGTKPSDPDDGIGDE